MQNVLLSRFLVMHIEVDRTFSTSGSEGGGRTRRACPPPLTAADLWFFLCPKRQFFLFFPRLLRSRFILSLILIDIWPKHAKNWLLLQTVTTFNDLLPPPLTRWQSPPCTVIIYPDWQLWNYPPPKLLCLNYRYRMVRIASIYLFASF